MPRGLTPDQPIEDRVKREALDRFARAYADGDVGALSGAHRAARAPGAGRPTRRRSRRGGALARRELPLRPGAARLGQDVAGSADGDRADAGGQADRRHVAEPQGDPQPAPCDRARGGAAGILVPRRQARRRGLGRNRVRRPVDRDLGGHRRVRRPVVRPRRGDRVGAHTGAGRRPRRRAADRRPVRRRSGPARRSRTCSRRARRHARSCCSATRTSSRR